MDLHHTSYVPTYYADISKVGLSSVDNTLCKQSSPDGNTLKHESSGDGTTLCLPFDFKCSNREASWLDCPSWELDDGTPPPSPAPFVLPPTPVKQRDFVCDICNSEYRHKQSLVSHRRRHAVKRPHTCHTCKMTFNDRSTLIKHRRRHTGSKPYTCDVCYRSFTQSGNMLRHKRSIHNIQNCLIDLLL